MNNKPEKLIQIINYNSYYHEISNIWLDNTTLNTFWFAIISPALILHSWLKHKVGLWVCCSRNRQPFHTVKASGRLENGQSFFSPCCNGLVSGKLLIIELSLFTTIIFAGWCQQPVPCGAPNNPQQCAYVLKCMFLIKDTFKTIVITTTILMLRIDTIYYILHFYKKTCSKELLDMGKVIFCSLNTQILTIIIF